MRLIAALLLLLVSACASKHQLAKCDGPLEALNASHWQPTKAELGVLAQRVTP